MKDLKKMKSAQAISRKEQQAVKGGSGRGLWVCTADYFECYFSKSQCQAICTNPGSCLNYQRCP